MWVAGLHQGNENGEILVKKRLCTREREVRRTTVKICETQLPNGRHVTVSHSE
jgi:hypothetical protein